MNKPDLKIGEYEVRRMYDEFGFSGYFARKKMSNGSYFDSYVFKPLITITSRHASINQLPDKEYELAYLKEQLKVK